MVEMATNDEPRSNDISRISPEQPGTNRPYSNAKDWSHSTNSWDGTSLSGNNYGDQGEFNPYGSHKGSGSHNINNKYK